MHFPGINQRVETHESSKTRTAVKEIHNSEQPSIKIFLKDEINQDETGVMAVPGAFPFLHDIILIDKYYSDVLVFSIHLACNLGIFKCDPLNTLLRRSLSTEAEDAPPSL